MEGRSNDQGEPRKSARGNFCKVEKKLTNEPTATSRETPLQPHRQTQRERSFRPPIRLPMLSPAPGQRRQPHWRTARCQSIRWAFVRRQRSKQPNPCQLSALSYWTDRFSSARKFNLGNSGTYAKNGVITYNTTNNLFDSNGLSSARQDLVTEAFNIFEEVLGIDFQSSSTSMQIFALEMKPMVHTHQQPALGEISTTSMST